MPQMLLLMQVVEFSFGRSHSPVFPYQDWLTNFPENARKILIVDPALAADVEKNLFSVLREIR